MDKNTNSNKEIIESQQLCLYKLIIDDNVKSQSQVEHQLVVSNLNVNEDKLLIAIDSEVSLRKLKNLVIQQQLLKHYSKLIILKKKNRRQSTLHTSRVVNTLWSINLKKITTIY